jgi:flagellar assembly factor FliW
MPLAHTRRFGDIQYDRSSVLTFPGGLPGFDGQPLFTLVEKPELAPIVFLQSLNTPELCFFSAPVAAIDPEYSLVLTREDFERLDLDPTRVPVPNVDVLPLALLCLPENGPLTANLLAPVVINLHNRVAVQAVRADTRYSHRHPIPQRSGEPLEPAC